MRSPAIPSIDQLLVLLAVAEAVSFTDTLEGLWRVPRPIMEFLRAHYTSPLHPDLADQAEDALSAENATLWRENTALKELIAGPAKQDRRAGALARPRQQQQRQAAVERWSEQAGADQELARAIGQAPRRKPRKASLPCHRVMRLALLRACRRRPRRRATEDLPQGLARMSLLPLFMAHSTFISAHSS